MGTPYFDAVKRSVERGGLRFNVPGHQFDVGSGMVGMFDGLAEYDVPQLLEGVDKGEGNALSVSLRETADLFNARKAWFLTGGASQANRIVGLMLAQLGYADEVVVAQRNSHSSFFDSVIMAGLNPVFVSPSVDSVLGVSHGVSVADVEEAIVSAGRKVKAVYVVSPSYYGAVADVGGLKKVAVKYDVPLIVDAAWGSHFGFDSNFPVNPLGLGADVVVSSTHKMVGSLTQSAMLFTGDTKWGKMLEDSIDRGFLLTQSTSTSSLLLSSLDVAKDWLGRNRDGFNSVVDNVFRFKELLRGRLGVGFVDERMMSGLFPDVVDVDVLKVGVDLSDSVVDGFTVHEGLFEKFGVFSEMATMNTVLFVVGLGKSFDYSVDMVNMLEGLLTDVGDGGVKSVASGFTVADSSVLNMRDAFFSPYDVVRLDDAVGRVSVDAVAAYPPGIPNVLPGEVFNEHVVKFLSDTGDSKGGYVRGAFSSDGKKVRVVKN